MKKKTSTAAIVVAIIFSILLFPMIMIGGIASGVVFSAESALLPERNEDFYRSFEESGGMDWIYDLIVISVEEGMSDGSGAASLGIELSATELFPRDQVETMVYDVYHKIIKGEEYQFDFSYQKNVMKDKLAEYFDEQTEGVVGENAELKAIAKETYMKEIDVMIEEEFGALEEELSAEVNGIYEEIYEGMDIRSLEIKTGYSMADRTELCNDMRMAGYFLLGLTAFLIIILLLCHLFRPSGFFTAGAFSLITGGLMFIGAKGIHAFLMSVINAEFNTAISSEVAAEEIPVFFLPMIETILGWCLTGFEKVGKIGLMTAVILILVGILLHVIKRNQAEPVSVYEMQ